MPSGLMNGQEIRHDVDVTTMDLRTPQAGHPASPCTHSTGNGDSWGCICAPAYQVHAILQTPSLFVGRRSCWATAHSTLMEQQTRYRLDTITKCQDKNIKPLNPKLTAAQQRRRQTDLFLQHTPWQSLCRLQCTAVRIFTLWRRRRDGVVKTAMRPMYWGKEHV